MEIEDKEKEKRIPLESGIAKEEDKYNLPTEEVPIPSVPTEAGATEIIIEKKDEPKKEEKVFRLVDYDKICIWLKIDGDRQVIDNTEPKILKDRLEARLFQFGSKFVSVVYEGERPYIYQLLPRGDNTVLNYKTSGTPLRRLVYKLIGDPNTTRKASSSRLQ